MNANETNKNQLDLNSPHNPIFYCNISSMYTYVPIFTLQYFNSYAIVKVISNRLSLLVFIPTCSGIRASFLYLSPRGLVKSSWSVSFVYKAYVSHPNKQFSIDSFLDWEGHYWVCQIFTGFSSCSCSLSLSDQSTTPVNRAKKLLKNFPSCRVRS